MTAATERAFLPAAMAVEQTPPSVLGRAVLWSVLLIFVAAVTWASIGSVDIVAVAPGQIIPTGHSKRVQPLQRGIVTALPVHAGKAVMAGDVVLQLDTRESVAELTRIESALDEAALELQRAKLMLRWLDDANASRSPGDIDDPVLLGQWQTFVAQQSVIREQRLRESAALETARRQQAKIEALLPITTRRAVDRKALADGQLLPESEYLDAEQARIEQVYELAATQAQVAELEAALAALDARGELQSGEFQQSLLERAAQAKHRTADLDQQRLKAAAQLEARTLRAPIDGVVEDLAVHGVGEVVTSAQVVMTIVPADRILEVEADLRNRDVGFVEVGQPVVVKIDAFPFTRHGTISGEISGLASEAVAEQGAELVYRLRIALQDNTMVVDGKAMSLLPGMTVAAEIRTGQRRLISYILSPLLRYADESARER